MENDRLIRILFKGVILVLFPLLLVGSLFFADFLQRILRRSLKKKGRDEVIRLLSYKGLFGIFDLLERKVQ